MTRRSYEQYCAVAKALDAVGERWTMLILRDLIHLGPRRFTDLRRGLPGIGKNLLAARLRDLEHKGIVQRRRLPPPSGSAVYELTPLGRGLEPAMIELGRWGGNLMGRREEGEFFLPTGHISAIRATFRPEAAAGVNLSCEFRIAGDAFYVRVENGEVEAKEGSLERPDLVVSTDLDTSISLMTREVSPEQALVDGKVSLEGDERDFARLIDLIAWVPPPVPAMS